MAHSLSKPRLSLWYVQIGKHALCRVYKFLWMNAETSNFQCPKCILWLMLIPRMYWALRWLKWSFYIHLFFPFFLTIAIWRSLLKQLWNNLIIWCQFSFWLNQALQLFCMRVVLMHVHVKFDLHYSCQVIILLYKLKFGILFNMELLIYYRFWCIAMICD